MCKPLYRAWPAMHSSTISITPPLLSITSRNNLVASHRHICMHIKWAASLWHPSQRRITLPSSTHQNSTNSASHQQTTKQLLVDLATTAVTWCNIKCKQPKQRNSMHHSSTITTSVSISKQEPSRRRTRNRIIPCHCHQFFSSITSLRHRHPRPSTMFIISHSRNLTCSRATTRIIVQEPQEDIAMRTMATAICSFNRHHIRNHNSNCSSNSNPSCLSSRWISVIIRNLSTRNSN